MTKEEVFQNLVLSTKDYLLSGRLLDALQAMQSLAMQGGNQTLMQKVQDILADYDRMLDFARQGGTDPLREHQFQHLAQRAVLTLMDLRRDYRLTHGDDLYVRVSKALALSATQAKDGGRRGNCKRNGDPTAAPN